MLTVFAVLAAAAVFEALALFLTCRYIKNELDTLRSDVRSAADSVRDAGLRFDDQFSADVSELLNYNYLK